MISVHAQSPRKIERCAELGRYGTRLNGSLRFPVSAELGMDLAYRKCGIGLVDAGDRAMKAALRFLDLIPPLAIETSTIVCLLPARMGLRLQPA
jgi:hypothetical protein